MTAPQSDSFTVDITARARWARTHNNGHPKPAWSTGEKLAVALVLRDKATLDALDYTVQEAAQRVNDGMVNPPTNFKEWLDAVRAAL